MGIGRGWPRKDPGLMEPTPLLSMDPDCRATAPNLVVSLLSALGKPWLWFTV